MLPFPSSVLPKRFPHGPHKASAIEVSPLLLEVAGAAAGLAVGVLATLDGRARTLALVVAALLGLSLAGLPLAGGSLAKLALKDLFGDGAAGVASQLSAAATTALTSASAIPDLVNSAMAAPINRSLVCKRLASRAYSLSVTAIPSPPVDLTHLRDSRIAQSLWRICVE